MEGSGTTFQTAYTLSPNTTSTAVSCIPSAGSGLPTLLSQETHSGVCDPKERVEMTNQKKQTSEAAVREIRWPALPYWYQPLS